MKVSNVKGLANRNDPESCGGARKGAVEALTGELVHEVYVRLADHSSISMEHRAQVFGLAAKIMRDILVDNSAIADSD